MRWITCTVAALAITLPTTTQAQQWTPEQQEIWDFERSCWSAQALESIMRCFHDDFLGWGLGSTVPTSKADRRPFFARNLETEDQVFLSLKPLAITVHGDVATVLYLATYTNKNKATGKERTVTERWTDVCLRQGGRWLWIADHGVLVSES